MINKLYYRFLHGKFFTRILLSYTAIILFTLGALSGIISNSYSQRVQRDAVNSNMQVMQNINSYLNQKNLAVKQMMQNVYINKGLYEDVIQFMENGTPMDTDEYYAKRNSIYAFLKSLSALDADILEVVLCRSNDNSYFYYERVSDRFYNDFPDKRFAFLELLDENLFGTRLFNNYTSPYTSNLDTNAKGTYSIATNLRGLDYLTRIGGLIVSFKSQNIINSFYNYNTSGVILVYSEDGDIIFDSSGKSTGQLNADLLSLKDSSVSEVFGKNSIINIYNNEPLKLTIASIIPKSELMLHIRKTTIIIYLLTIALMLAAVVLAYIVSRHFFKRINSLNNGLKIIQKGNLSAKLNIGKGNDEISQIASNINKMCDKLNEYIEKVYVINLKEKDAQLLKREAEVRQKGAELYALQSQINPHFLYNTLEAVRMRAISSGDEDVSKMIYMLASLFRSSIKGSLVVKIKEELDYCSSYLELYNVRYEDRLLIEFDVGSEIYNYAVPRHLLQPVIENSLLHGIDFEKEHNLIRITAYIENSDIFIVISDNGKGMDKGKLAQLMEEMEKNAMYPHNGIGLSNVHHRIRLIYGPDYGVQVNSLPFEGTTVTIKIKAKTVKELEEDVQYTNC